MDEPFKILGQLTGFKNMKTTGGWRLEIDLFESKLPDILKVAALVNEQAVVEITLEPYEG